MNWRDLAACKGMDPDWWFPQIGESNSAARAKAVCASCPVQAECLVFGLDMKDGIWGGLALRERRRARRVLVASRSPHPADCGCPIHQRAAS